MRLTRFLLSALMPAVAAASAQETHRVYLSGHGKDDAVPWRFFCTSGKQSGFWTNLVVPSNWELHGFGTLKYGRDGTNPPPEVGRYERDFNIPGAWSGGRVFLVFEGAMTDATAWVNGQQTGPTHQGAFYRFKHEITGLLKYGAQNRLEVTVSKKSADATVNNAERKADYWIFGGLFRPVYLETTPPEFIERVAIDARADGALSMDVFVDGNNGADAVEAEVTSLKGRPAGPSFHAALSGGRARLSARINSPRTWTAETPNLYQVNLRLKSGKRTLHRFGQRFGFRTFEVRDGEGLFVNGQRVILQGANRHSAWPDSGRCLSTAIHRLDIETMKDMNMNAVRMSHYPPDAEFLDLCDELGLYVLDELAGWQNRYGTEVGRNLVQEMVTRDVNHPSILFWDNGNEGGWNTNLDSLFSQFDPQKRRVLHPWSPFSGIDTSHYLNYEKAGVSCRGEVSYSRDGKRTSIADKGTINVYLPTEFLHGLYDGGAGAGLQDYWAMMRNSPYLGGGFLWALTDEGILHDGMLDLAGNLAPDGIVGPYREREASFYAVKDLWSPIQITDLTLPSGFDGTLHVENRFSFTDARQCHYKWQLRQFRAPGDTRAGFRVVATGTAKAPAIAPGQNGLLQLKLPADWQEADALALRVTDPTGRELWTYVWPLGGLTQSCAMIPSGRIGAPAVASETDSDIVVQSGELRVSFAKANGCLQSVQRGLRTYSLTNGPRLREAPSELLSLNHRRDGNDVVVTAEYGGGMKSVQWRVHSNGWLGCDYVFVAHGPRESLGVAFDYPEDRVKAKKWLGHGPYRVWKNRLRGGTLDVWQNAYNDTVTGYSGWVYPEFKGCFSQVRWMQLQTSEGPITALINSGDLFVQVLTPQQPPADLRGKTSVTLPNAGLAFLHAIPAIGTKFNLPEQGGPQGGPTHASGDYRGSVSFFFGEVR